MPVVFDPFSGSYKYEVPTVATRGDALDAEVPRSQIEPALVADTERTLRLASRSLGIEVPKLRWLPPDVAGIRGICFGPNEVWVTPQSGAATKQTLLHELRHCWGLSGDRYSAVGLHEMPDRQRDADSFAASWQPAAELKTASGESLSHRTMPGALQVKAAVGGWEVAGYASTFGGEPDAYGDVIAPGAFAASISQRSTKFLFEHTVPIGNQLEIREDAKGLFGRWSIVDTQAGADARKLAQAGVLDSLSIGYVTVKAEDREDGARVLTQIDLYEVSAVAIPANPNAVITTVKTRSGRPAERIDVGAELLRRRAAQVRRGIELRKVSGVRA